MWLPLAVLLVTSADAAPPRGSLGVGLGGGPGVTGLSAKLYMQRTSLQVTAGGWQVLTDEVEGGSGYGLSSDYQLEMPDIVYTQAFNLAWSVGIGGTLAVPGETPEYVSLSAVTGLALNFKRSPMDLVFEYRPRVAVLPNLWIDLFNYSAHVRYYF
jgi:hypothetical protein